MTREELDRLEAESDAIGAKADVAHARYSDALIEYRYGRTPDEKEAELRRELNEGADYVTAAYAREVLNRLDELRKKGGAS